MDWGTVIGALVGALVGGGMGSGTSLFLERRRARSENDSKYEAREARAEERRVQLWEISLPAASRLQELFASMIRRCQPPDPWDEPYEGGDFDDDFQEWWASKDVGFRQDVALVPSGEYRNSLTLVGDGARYSWAMHSKGGYATSSRDSALKVAETGLELISTWMRDEQTKSEDLTLRLTEIESGMVQVSYQFQLELDDVRDPKGYLTRPTPPE